MAAPESLGADLAAVREDRDLTLQQVEQRIKIRVHYLEALENDDYAALPSTVQGRGFLRNYARFLGMDADAAETRFNMGLIAQSRTQNRRRSVEAPPSSSRTRAPSRISSQTADSTPPPRRSNGTPSTGSTGKMLTPTVPMQVVVPTNRRNGLSDPAAERAAQRRRQTRTMTLRAIGTLTFATFMLVALLTYALHPNLLSAPLAALIGIQSDPTATGVPTATPPILPTSTPTLLAVILAPGSVGNATGGATAVNGSPNTLSIQITVHDRSPLVVKIDNDTRYSGVPVPNTVITYTIQGTQQLYLHTGSASSLDVSLNGVQQPSLGLDHQIIDKIYSVAGVQSAVTLAPTSPAVSSAGSAPTSALITFTPAPAVAPTQITPFSTAALKP